jgi:hypothetical protein
VARKVGPKGRGVPGRVLVARGRGRGGSSQTHTATKQTRIHAGTPQVLNKKGEWVPDTRTIQENQKRAQSLAAAIAPVLNAYQPAALPTPTPAPAPATTTGGAPATSTGSVPPTAFAAAMQNAFNSYFQN